MVEFELWQPPESALPLWEAGAPGFQAEYGQPQPTITPFLVAAERPVGAVIVLPGGGYGVKAGHEAAPIAAWLNGVGIAAFVVDYRVAPYRSPVPLLDARRAIQVVRSRAREWGIHPSKVGILGFSAGGHLASTAATHLEPEVAQEGDAVDAFSFRPDAVILCYPVISFGPFGHIGSMENLLGPNPLVEQRAAFSNETRVTSETPPAFLWHTATDEAVPVENSLLFAQSLADHKIPFELHIFAEGVHGVGLAHGHPSAEPWTGLCARWLKDQGF